MVSSYYSSLTSSVTVTPKILPITQLLASVERTILENLVQQNYMINEQHMEQVILKARHQGDPLSPMDRHTMGLAHRTQGSRTEHRGLTQNQFGWFQLPSLSRRHGGDVEFFWKAVGLNTWNPSVGLTLEIIIGWDSTVCYKSILLNSFHGLRSTT